MIVLPVLSSYLQNNFLDNLFGGWLIDAQKFLRDLPELLLWLILAFVLIRLLSLITHRMVYVAERHASEATRISQVKALSSVIRTTGIAAITLFCITMALATLGLNLIPLLAPGAAAGVAIGFAGQTLVKDMLNGIFILMEDQFGVGEIVKVAGVAGTVESMTLRKTTIRDADGTLYVIPNSLITTVANQSRDFSVATINVSVDYSANPDEVMALLTNIAMGVRNDPAYSDAFLTDPKVLGVDALRGSEVIYPLQLRTKANKQWDATRETRRRIRLALEEHEMLPGDPYRVFNRTMDKLTGKPKQSIAEAKMDPTQIKPNEINPFTGEGM